MWEEFEEVKKETPETPIKAKKGLSSWQVMSSVFKPLHPTKQEIESINGFFFCSYLSQNSHSLPISQILNRYYNIPISVQYRFAKDYAEMTQLSKKINFIQFNKKKIPPEMVKITDNIKRKYQVNQETAIEYFNLMDNDTRNKIYNMYEEGVVK